MTSLEKIEQQLIELYGPFVTIHQLAELLHRSPAGLAYTLSQSSPFAESVNTARVKLGRRVYFRASDLAKALTSGQQNAQGAPQ